MYVATSHIAYVQIMATEQAYEQASQDASPYAGCHAQSDRTTARDLTDVVVSIKHLSPTKAASTHTETVRQHATKG